MDLSTYLLKVANTLDEGIHEGLRHHIANDIPLTESIYRIGSTAYMQLFVDARKLYRSGGYTPDDESAWFLEQDVGEHGLFMGELVPLDVPMTMEEASENFKHAALKEAADHKGKKVELGKPRRSPAGHRKKFLVYVKNADGKVVQVGFGQPGMTVKNRSDKSRKNFLARHRCHECKGGPKCPKTSPRYWSCNVHRYHKQLGLKSDKPW